MTRSPTRLEGMETATDKGALSLLRMSPTRLEGMETDGLVRAAVAEELSPTRLEGMETAQEPAPRNLLRVVSDPP